MTRATLRTLLMWLRNAGVEITEPLLFQTAYVHTYSRADIQCMYCYYDYCNTGRVPAFVVQFVRDFFLLKGEVK